MTCHLPVTNLKQAMPKTRKRAKVMGDKSVIDWQAPALTRRRIWRSGLNGLLRAQVLFGGLSVLFAIALMMVYLGYIVWPLFQGARLTLADWQSPAWLKDQAPAWLLAVEEQNQLGFRLGEKGEVVFFALDNGRELLREHLPLPEGVHIKALVRALPEQDLYAAALSDGSALVFAPRYQTRFQAQGKSVQPSLGFPYGNTAFVLDKQGRALNALALSEQRGRLLLIAASGQQLNGLWLRRESSLLAGDHWTAEPLDLPAAASAVTYLDIDPRGRFAYVQSGKDRLELLDLRKPRLISQYHLLAGSDLKVTASGKLNGGVSLLIGDSGGAVTQWFAVADKDGHVQLKSIRRFQLADSAIVQIEPEARRKGFAALDAAGNLGLFHSTAERRLLDQHLPTDHGKIALSPQADRLLVEAGGAFAVHPLHNPHPELSWQALWSKVWYENYAEPEYIWQSSASTVDFEAKLSLAPLTFGTLKAALVAMLFAAPLAIAAAVYSAYFMAPALRRKVKPVIELMEALPTVILGFFAALILAPYVEDHLPGLFSLFLILPLGTLALAFCCRHLPLSRLDGYESLLLIPLLLLLGWATLQLSPLLEAALFNGDMRLWLSARGIGYEQRNALVVGLAMGFAVIPNIYSLAEDALAGVPKSLTQGSLALGATLWQTLLHVLLPAAGAGIFSALMIGFGRAVGETMIVLMASGNTPLINGNLFEGMRTLAANVAVEMPEAAVDSTHYRLLFLSALLLLLLCFVMNSLAEWVRQRLRRRYAAL